MIWIRADGGKNLGMGHIMRCCSVAEEIEKRGEQVCFITANDAPGQVLLSRGFNTIVLGTDYLDMESELVFLNQLCQEHHPSTILVDSYSVTKTYIRALQKMAPVVYMDDMCELDFSVDVLINYNLYANVYNYPLGAQTATRKMLLGPVYAPLRKEFSGVHNPIRKQVKKILITTGGSDPYNLTEGLLNELLTREVFSECGFIAVSGAFNENLPRLRELSKNESRVQLFVNVTNMQDLMEECDLALSAGGSTCYELSSVGIPFAVFSFAENQEQIVRVLSERGLVLYGGSYLTQRETLITEAVNALENVTDYETRLDYSLKLQTTTDGGGAARIAEVLTGMK